MMRSFCKRLTTKFVRNDLHSPAPRLHHHRALKLLRIHEVALAAIRWQQSAKTAHAVGLQLYDLQGAIRQHAQRGAEKLREPKSLARAVLVFLKTDRFRPDLPQYSPSLAVEMELTSQDTRDILHAAQEALLKIYRPKYGYKKAGVMLIGLTDENRQQLSLMDTPQTEEERQRSQKLMATMDALNEKMGKGLPEKNAPWHLRCANRSPLYTTNWDELMVAYTDEGAIKRDKSI